MCEEAHSEVPMCEGAPCSQRRDEITSPCGGGGLVHVTSARTQSCHCVTGTLTLLSPAHWR